VFAKSGMVHAVNVDPERIFYDSTISAHHHFYNIDTGQLMDIPLEDLSFEEIPKLPDNTEIEDLQVIIKVKNKASTLTSV
jgi:Fur family iron response transcriptional regulator